jgi:hypothetical protein
MRQRAKLLELALWIAIAVVILIVTLIAILDAPPASMMLSNVQCFICTPSRSAIQEPPTIPAPHAPPEPQDRPGYPESPEPLPGASLETADADDGHGR